MNIPVISITEYDLYRRSNRAIGMIVNDEFSRPKCSQTQVLRRNFRIESAYKYQEKANY